MDVLLLTVTCLWLFIERTVVCLDNGLARTPPMGWMDWERFRCNIDCKDDPANCIGERLIKETADAMVKGGFLDAGYQYVSIDDCWMLNERGPDGQLQPDPDRFPGGMKALADYVHSKGLKLGIYEDVGTLTCKKYPGSEGHLQQDAQTFSSWGIDMLKLDCCYAGNLEEGYGNMSKYLNQTGRPILFSCSWPACSGAQTKYPLVVKHCNTWRNYKDLSDSFETVYAAIDFYGNNTYNFQQVAGPGHWNDPDQLILGDFGLSYDQERTQFGMWCMMASPLFMSVDLRNIRNSSRNLLINRNLLAINRDELILGDFGLSYDQERTQFGMWCMMASPLFMSVDLRNICNSSRDLLINRNLLAINQDELGVQGYRISKKDGLEVWLKPLMGVKFKKGSFALAVLNYFDSGAPLPFSATLKDFSLSFLFTMYHLTEAFEGSDMGTFGLTDKLSFHVNPTGIYIVTATPVGAPVWVGYQ